MVRSFNKYKWLTSLWGYIFILPAVLTIAIFWVLPSIQSIYYGFFKYDGIRVPEFIGMKNFIDFFTDGRGLNSLKVAVYYSIGTLPISIIIGFIIAIILCKRWFKGAGFFSVVFFIPFIMPYIAVSVIWKWMLEPVSGLVNSFLGLLGIPGQNWLTTPGLAMGCIIFISIWKNIGLIIILYVAAIRHIPDSYLEAASLDGAGEFQKARYIIWPFMLPTTVFLTVMAIIDAFKVYDQIYALTKGRPSRTTEIIAYYIWQAGFDEGRMGYASAASTIMLVIMVILTVIQWEYYVRRISFLEN